MGEQLFVQINEDKKAELKSIAAQHNHTLKQIINVAVDDYIQNKGLPVWMN